MHADSVAVTSTLNQSSEVRGLDPRLFVIAVVGDWPRWTLGSRSFLHTWFSFGSFALGIISTCLGCYSGLQRPATQIAEAVDGSISGFCDLETHPNGMPGASVRRSA